MNTMTVQIAAAAGACATVAGIAVGALALSSQAGYSAEPAEPSVTVQTTQLAPTTEEVPEAKPQITGPAPLPTEDQGLPG